MAWNDETGCADLQGASVKCVNKDGYPVLHVAVRNKHADAISALVEAGANVNAKGPQLGNTALHEAVGLGTAGTRVVDALLK